MGRFRSSIPRSRLPWHRRVLADPGLIRRWAVVALLSVFTATLVQRVVSDAEAVRRRWGDTRSVLVLERTVAVGDPLAGAVTTVRWPVALTPSDAYRRLPPGARAGAIAGAGLPVTPALVDQRGTGARRGSRLMAVPVDTTALPLEVGDQVDVWATTDPSISGRGLATRRVAIDALVASSGPRAVVVEVEPDEVAAVTEAVALSTVTLVAKS